MRIVIGACTGCGGAAFAPLLLKKKRKEKKKKIIWKNSEKEKKRRRKNNKQIRIKLTKMADITKRLTWPLRQKGLMLVQIGV